MFLVNIKDTRTTPSSLNVSCSFIIPCSSLFIVNFEHVIAGWVRDGRQISLAILTLLWRGPLSYRNLPIDLQSNGLITAFVMKELSEFKWIN